MAFAKKLLSAFARLAALAVIVLATLVGLHFPYSHDRPLTKEQVESNQKYYAEAYKRAPGKKTQAEIDFETEYEKAAKYAAEQVGVIDVVRAFAQQHNLADKAVLDIGSGRGYLQDIVANYTGLDISPNVAPLYHKKFVVGSATSMPFADNSFDAAWSIWVYEHVPNPEQAFLELRRVVRDGGEILLAAAWNCKPWAADGYAVRPYSDFGLFGKLVKASIPVRDSFLFHAATQWPIRAIRSAALRFGPTTLRYQRLKPNYGKYWIADADAVNSIDSHEAMIWFLSRGDECLNCEKGIFLEFGEPLVIRVHKKG